MKKLLLITLLFLSGTAMAQNVGIGTNDPEESAILDLKSSNKGFLLPRLTEKQKALIPQPAEGLMIYQTDASQGVYLYQGGNWKNMGSANVTTSGSSANAVTAYTPNYLLTADGSGNVVSSGIYVNPSNGFLGIGTINPKGQLEINSRTTALSLVSTINTEAVTDNQELTAINFYKHYGLANSASIKMLHSGGPNNYANVNLAFYTASSGNPFAPNLTERMRINDQGFVGIGTFNPKSLFDISGQTPSLSLVSKINTEAVIDNQELTAINFYKHYGISKSASIKMLHSGGPNNYLNVNLAFYTASGGTLFSPILTERMRISDQGFVGIGTTTPKSLFDISGQTPSLSLVSKINTEAVIDNQELTSINFYKHYGLANSASIKMLHSGGPNNYANVNLAFYTASSGNPFTPNLTERMRISDQGFVGIGLNNPKEKLDVSGNIKQTGVIASLVRANDEGKLVSSIAISEAIISSTSNSVKVDSKSAGYLAIGDFGAATPMNIPTGYRLVVQDGIITEKVKVAVRNQSDWADYVFEPNYTLLPLNEVEQFVKENKHLPNVPSADEMVKEGVEIGKTSKIFMEKIEELTLYMIELKKEIEALKAENSRLKK